MSATQRTELIIIQRGTATANEYNESEFVWATYATLRARVRFGTAQEKREAAQEGGSQAATFECIRSSVTEAVTLKDRISYLGSFWDLTETAPLDRQTIRFTGTRNV